MSLSFGTILFDSTGEPIAPDEISERMAVFPYRDAVQEIIRESQELDRDGNVFVKCTARILSNFGMTRSGPFKGVELRKNNSVRRSEILLTCWKKVGGHGERVVCNNVPDESNLFTIT